MATNILTKSQVQKYEGEYGKYIRLTAEAMKKKYNYDWTDYDTVAFGQYANTWESYRDVFESDATSRADLAAPLSTDLGLIAMAYAALPIQNFASIQPLDQEVGVVYYREMTALQNRGTIKSGEVVQTPYGRVDERMRDYVTDVQTNSVTITNPAVTTYNGQLSGTITKGSVHFNLASKVKGIDDGEGHLLGVGIDSSASTIDYDTGKYSITFTDLAGANVQANDVMDITYRQSNTDTDSIPTAKWELKSKPVKVQYDILQSQYSSISELVLRKKLGAGMSDQISADLVSQIQSAVLYRAINKLREAALRAEVMTGEPLTWSAKPAAGVSMADHRKTFTDKFINATDQMYRLAGVGEVTTIITGMRGKQILTTDGMQITRNTVSGPHLCGVYNGIPVYYVPNSSIGANEMIVVYRGSNWFEAPLVYAPFLPVTVVSGTAVNNVLTNAHAVYHAAAMEKVVDGFAIRITIVD